MRTNVGRVDRAIRFVLAFVALGVAFFAGLTIQGVVALAVAVILAVTAGAGFCPVYRWFGITTDRQRLGQTNAGRGKRAA